MTGKMKMFTLLGIVGAMIVGTIAFGIISAENSKEVFAADGYILGNIQTESDSENDKQKDNSSYFDSGSKYKKRYPGKVQFESTGGKSTVSEKSFVHYTNDNLMSFVDGVFVDLDAVKTDSFNYYNIPGEVTVEKQGVSYAFNTTKQQQTFSNFLWKISDSTYMIVSPTVSLHLSENNVINLEQYVELRFVDENVVQLKHRDGFYQTIAETAYIDLANDVRIRLADRYIVFNNQEKLAMGQMVIDADDNIDIIASKNNEKEKSDEEDTAQTAAAGGGGGGAGGGTGGVGGTATNNQAGVIGAGDGTDEDLGGNNEVVTENKFPSFSITDMETGLVSMSANIEIDDDDDLLGEDGVSVKIVENGSDKVVYSKNIDKGQYQISISTDGLDPDQEYTLIANSDYYYKDEEYNKDFISQMFKTNALGLSISKKKLTDDSITVHIEAQDYCEVSTAKLSIKQAGADTNEDEVAVTIAELLEEGGADFIFDGLDSNSRYQITLGDLYTGSSMLLEENNLVENYKTLKKAPIIGLPKVSINKSQSSFSLYLSNVSDEGTTQSSNSEPIIDEDKGVESVKFEIYSAGQITDGQPNGDPITVIDAKKNTNVEAKVDGVTLQRNVTYCYRAVVEFYDNEKIVEYESAFSSGFSLESAKYPTVTFEPKDTELEDSGIKLNGIEHDSFRGIVTIHDDDGVLVRESPNIITYSITGNDGGDTQLKTWVIAENGELSAPIVVTGLRSNTTYTVTFMGTVNLDDGNDDMEVYLGNFQVTTSKKAETVEASIVAPTTANDMSRQDAFDVKLYMDDFKQADGNMTDADYELSTMDSFQLKMYEAVQNEEGKYEKGTLWASKTIHNDSTYDPKLYTYNSSLRALTSKDNANSLVVTPETFGMNNNSVTKTAYILEVKDAVDYTDFANSIDVKAENGEPAEFVIYPHGFIPALPANPNNSVTVKEVLYGQMQDETMQNTYPIIRDSGAAAPDLGLSANTTVGYYVRALSFPSTSLKYAEKVTYKMYEVKNYQNGAPVINANDKPVQTAEFEVPENASSLPSWQVPIGVNGYPSRGKIYYFTYNVEMDLSMNANEKIIANYPEDALHGEGVVLRSDIQKCYKETPNIYMYLKEQTGSGSSGYTQAYNYQYTDVDNAYIVNSDAASDENKFIVDNKSGLKYFPWNKEIDNSGTYRLTVTNIAANKTLSIYKNVSLLDKIPGYAADTSETRQTVTVQPVSEAAVSDNDIVGGTSKVTFRLESDASRLKVVLDVPDTFAHKKKLAAVKVTLNCDGQNKTFDYLPLDEWHTAYIPLINIKEFKGKEITAVVNVYYDNGNLGTDYLSMDSGEIFMKNFSRSGGYSYYGSTAVDSMYKVNTSFINGIFANKKSEKTFTATKLHNSTGVEAYTGNESTMKFVLDEQGLNKNVTGSNPEVDTYYVFSRAKKVNVSPTAEGNDKITFSYIRPTITAVTVNPGLVDAEMTFTYNGVDKSAVEDNKLYLVISTISGNYEPASVVGTYEIDISNSNSTAVVNLTGDNVVTNLRPDATYYFTVFGDFKSDSGAQAERLRLLDADENEFEASFKTLKTVTFSNQTYAYIANSYNNKQLRFRFNVNVVSGYNVKFTLQDAVTGEPINITGYDTMETIVSNDNTLLLPVGKTGDRIPGAGNLVYGRSYKITATAYTKGANPIEVGTYEKTFKLAKLSDPLFSATGVAGKDPNGIDRILFTILVRDLQFAIVDENVNVKIYSGRYYNTESLTGVNPIQEETISLYNSATGVHSRVVQRQISLTGLQSNSYYTLVISGVSDNGYGTAGTKTIVKIISAKTLNEYGIGYSDVYAVPQSGGAVTVEFYDYAGFSNVESMDYTIYADRDPDIEPISGTIAGSSFVSDTDKISAFINAGITKKGPYTIELQLKKSDGTIIGSDSIGFSY